MLQHLTGGRVDLVMGRGNTGPVYPWFGQDIRRGVEIAIENYDLLRRLWREDVVNWEDRKSTRLNSSHVAISYAVVCLKKKKTAEPSEQSAREGQQGAWRLSGLAGGAETLAVD